MAPYEADPQLAFLASLDPARGGVAAVVTEDSDLVAYGCPRTLFKLTRCRSPCPCMLALTQSVRLLAGPPAHPACVVRLESCPSQALHCCWDHSRLWSGCQLLSTYPE